jgi:TolB-like protein/DNA-binding SARP family transcriptional activator/Flp pilus assembly protein TadD
MFCLKLFGGATLVSPEGPMTGRAVQRRRLALAALLAVARERGMSRDKLLAYLWPEADAERARHLLSDSVYRINQALGREAVVAAGDGLRLSPELPSDVGQFEEAIARGDDEAAVSLYAGPFLDGFFVQESAELERWIEGERRRLGDEYAGAVERLAEAAERAGDERTAVRWWRRVAAHDPLSSRIALRLMRALERSGDRPAAIQHAGLHGRMLEQELGARPDPEVTAFAKELLTAPLVAEPPPARSPAGGKAEPFPTLLPPGGTAETDLPPVRGGGGRGTARLLAAAIVVVGLGLAVVFDRLPTAAQPPAPISTIAVLPFENLSSDRDAEYLSDGITEEIGAALGRVGGLRVAAHTSAFSFKGQRVDVREVGKRLGVGAVLEGSVRKQGARLRVTTRLVETAQGYQIWTETYDRDFEDAFAVQQEIAGDVVSRLRGEKAGADSARLVPGVGPDAEAYDLYLKGRYAWHRRTAESIRSAVELLGRAVDRAPHWARAHAGLADAYAVSGFYDYLPPRDAFPAAERSARRALELDPKLAAPHATLGYVHLYYEWRWIPADEEFRRAIALDPAYSTAHQWYGNYLTAMGRFPEAMQHMREAQERDPLSLIANAALGWSQYYARDYLDAVKQFRRTLELNPAFELAHLWQGQALVQLGDLEGAVREVGEAVRLSKGTALTRAALAHVLASAGHRDSARAVLAALSAPGQQYVPSYEVAKAFLAMGDKDKAMEWLERAYAERAHSMAFLSVDPQLDGLRKDPRFEALRKKVTNPEGTQRF